MHGNHMPGNHMRSTSRRSTPSPIVRFLPSPIARLLPSPIVRFLPSPIVRFLPSPIARLLRTPIARLLPTGISIALLATATLLSTAAPSSLAGEASVVDGVTYVRNDATPGQGTRTVTLEELWRAGGDDDEVFFGVVARVLDDDDGNIYLLDSQLSEVQVYTSAGERLKTLGREGDGPGETRNPNDFFFMPDGKVGMVQAFPGKVVLVDGEGTPAGGYNYNAGDPSQGQFSVLIRSLCRGGNIVMGGIRMSFGQGGTSDQTYFLATCDAEGVEQHRYLAKPHTINYADFVLDELKMDFVWARVDVGPDGRVYLAPARNEYAIQVYSPDGKLERVIEREYESWTRSDEEKRQARLTIEAVGRNYPVPVREITFEDTEPDLGWIRVTDDGNLWVETSRSGRAQEDGVFSTIDVFDPAGHFVEQVRFVAPGDATRDAFFLLDDDRVVIVTGALEAFRSMQGVSEEEGAEEEEAAPLAVIYYSMGG